MALTVLALHYWAGAGHEFDAVRRLLPAGATLLAPDLPGFGKAAAPAGFEYSVGAYADWVLAFAQLHCPTSFALLGHSMGGKIALAVAARQPKGLRHLVLLAPSPPAGEPISAAKRAAALRAHGNPEAAEKTLHTITQHPLAATQQRQVVADNLRCSHAAWDAWLRRGTREDISALMPHVAVPCHVMVGHQDRAIMPATQRRLTLPLLPDGTGYQELPGMGHLLPLEAPAAPDDDPTPPAERPLP